MISSIIENVDGDLSRMYSLLSPKVHWRWKPAGAHNTVGYKADEIMDGAMDG